LTARHSADVDRTLRVEDGRRVGFATFGDPEGAPVFYFHGLASSRLEGALAHAVGLQRNICLVALDRPGIGLSDPRPGHRISDIADDVIAVANELRLEQFSLISVSSGGPFALATAAKLPERVRAIALISSPAPYREPSSLVGMDIRSRAFLVWLPRFAPWLIGPIWNRLAKLSDSDPVGLLRMIADTMPSSERRAISSPEVAEVFMDAAYEAFRTGTGGVVAEQRLLARDWGFALDAIKAPVWLWHGEDDETSPIGMAHWLAAALPKCQAQFLPGRGAIVVDDVLPDAITTLGDYWNSNTEAPTTSRWSVR
jgi:pimeloyl-ACP methyl ester carboxylesterase